MSDPNKGQSVFNDTRAFWGRLWLMPKEYPGPGYVRYRFGDVSGPILTVDAIYRPDRLGMMMDEQWDRFVATSGRLGHNDSAYNANEYGFWYDNNLGVYHGPPVRSGLHPMDESHPEGVPFLWPQGSVGYDDGHAALERGLASS